MERVRHYVLRVHRLLETGTLEGFSYEEKCPAIIKLLLGPSHTSCEKLVELAARKQLGSHHAYRPLLA